MHERLSLVILGCIGGAACLLVVGLLAGSDSLEALGGAVFLFGMLLAGLHWLGIWSVGWALAIAVAVVVALIAYRLAI
jgi:hypothetical protein